MLRSLVTEAFRLLAEIARAFEPDDVLLEMHQRLALLEARLLEAEPRSDR